MQLQRRVFNLTPSFPPSAQAPPEEGQGHRASSARCSSLQRQAAKVDTSLAYQVSKLPGPVDTAETQPVDDREVAQLLKMISELPTSPEVSADSKRAKFQGVRRHGLPAKQGQLTATQALPAAERATPIWRVFSPVDPADEPAATPKARRA